MRRTDNPPLNAQAMRMIRNNINPEHKTTSSIVLQKKDHKFYALVRYYFTQKPFNETSQSNNQYYLRPNFMRWCLTWHGV